MPNPNISISTTEEPKLLPDEWPLSSDCYHQGVVIGKNVMVLFEKNSNEFHDYVIIRNTTTGEGIRVHLRP